MSTTSENNKRIIKNTSFLYVRMLFLMGVGFFTTRKVLETLGVEDLGIYNVVGSLVIMFDFVSSGLSNATQRYLNIGLGKNDTEKTRQYFSQSLVIHIALVTIIAILAEIVGVWFVKNKLVIPHERLDAAIIILHFSVISIILRFIKICYESDIIARERMSIYAYLSIIEGIGKLLICYAVIYCTSMDKLVLYGMLLLGLNLIVTIFNIIYCTINFKETHFRFCREKKVYQELLSFIGINSFGIISWALGKQGSNIVLNMFFGPAVSGARGLASQLESVVTQFSSNINIAVRPQITQLYAQNKFDEMIILAHRATKYIFFLALIISTPLLFQTKELLSIWLKEVPDYTIIFVQILIFEVLGIILGSTYNSVSMSIGKIKNIQIYGRLITLSGLPISYAMLKIWQNPYLPTVIMTILTFLYSIFIVYDINKHLHFGIRMYLKEVIYPILKTMLLSFIGCLIIVNLINIENILLSFFVVTVLLCLFSIVIVTFTGLKREERIIIINMIRSRFSKQTIH